MSTKKLSYALLLATLTLAGCGGGNTTSNTSTGYFVDSPVINADYDCIADNNYNKTTGADGSFNCIDMSNVRFRIGNLTLGEIHTLPSDTYVFPQDLIGVARDTGINNAKVIAMAQLLQSLDSDGNPENGITIAKETKIAIAETKTTFNPADLTVYQDSTSAFHKPTCTQAKKHLEQTYQKIHHDSHSHDTDHNSHDTTHDTDHNSHDTTHDTDHNSHDTTHDTDHNSHDTTHDTDHNSHNTTHDTDHNSHDTTHDTDHNSHNTTHDTDHNSHNHDTNYKQ